MLWLAVPPAPRRSRGLRSLIWMARPHPFVAFPTIATVGYEVGRLHFNHRNIRFILIMLVDISHTLPPHSGHPCNLRSLRFRDLLDRRLGSMGKLTLALLCAPTSSDLSTHFRRANGAAWRFPARFNSSTSCLKLLRSWPVPEPVASPVLRSADLSFSSRMFVFASVFCSSSSVYIFLAHLLQEFFDLIFSRPLTLYNFHCTLNKYIEHMFYYTKGENYGLQM